MRLSVCKNQGYEKVDEQISSDNNHQMEGVEHQLHIRDCLIHFVEITVAEIWIIGLERTVSQR